MKYKYVYKKLDVVGYVPSDAVYFESISESTFDLLPFKESLVLEEIRAHGNKVYDRYLGGVTTTLSNGISYKQHS